MFNFATPPIPNYIRQIHLRDYKNIFQYPASYFPNPQHPNLWGTETLCGDWDGRLLIVAKDFAPTEYLNARCDGRPPYSHTIERSQTNKNLVEFMTSAGHALDISGRDNTSCGVLYASACFLLKEGDQLRTHISRDALKESWPAIDFTIKNMPKLTDIVLCGVHAFSSFRIFGSAFDEPRSTLLQRNEPMKWSYNDRAFVIHLVCHPTQVAVNAFGAEANQIRWKKIVASAFKRV